MEKICNSYKTEGVYESIIGASQMLKKKAEEISSNLDNVSRIQIMIDIEPASIPQLQILKSNNIVFDNDIDNDCNKEQLSSAYLETLRRIVDKDITKKGNGKDENI